MDHWKLSFTFSKLKGHLHVIFNTDKDADNCIFLPFAVHFGFLANSLFNCVCKLASESSIVTVNLGCRLSAVPNLWMSQMVIL